jgi:hypothetical protein
VLEVPATTLRNLMRGDQVHGVVLERMITRIARTTTEMLAPLDIAMRPMPYGLDTASMTDITS